MKKCNSNHGKQSYYLVDKNDFISSESLKIELPSKNRLRKCDNGLHEFKESKPIKVSDYLYETKWKCLYCGILIDNR